METKRLFTTTNFLMFVIICLFVKFAYEHTIVIWHPDYIEAKKAVEQLRAEPNLFEWELWQIKNNNKNGEGVDLDRIVPKAELNELIHTAAVKEAEYHLDILRKKPDLFWSNYLSKLMTEHDIQPSELDIEADDLKSLRKESVLNKAK